MPVLALVVLEVARVFTTTDASLVNGSISDTGLIKITSGDGGRVDNSNTGASECVDSSISTSVRECGDSSSTGEKDQYEGIAMAPTLDTDWSGVRLVNNKYEGIKVAISSSLNSSHNIVSSIQKMMKNASETMFSATNHRIYFGTVQVLIPSSLIDDMKDAVITTESFEGSVIIIAEHSDVYHGQPYTVQPGICSDPGRFIHLSPEYMTDEKEVALYGPRDRALVRQFARLRWGVFEEFGHPDDPVSPLVYCHPGEKGRPMPRLNYCSEETPPWTLSGNCCQMANDTMNSTCSLLDTETEVAHYYGNNVPPQKMRLCETGKTTSNTTSNYQHNSIAPTRHNVMCRGKSLWDVLSRHPDFCNPALKVLPSDTDTTPVIKLVRQEAAKFVLILDFRVNTVSRACQAASYWILHHLDQDGYLGLVKITYLKMSALNMTSMRQEGVQYSIILWLCDELIRPEIWSNFHAYSGDPEDQHATRHTRADGSYTKTNITKRDDDYTSYNVSLRDAFIKAASMVRQDSLSKGNAVFVLVTHRTNVEASLKYLVEPDIRLVAITLGDKSNPTLESIAVSSRGKYFTVLDSDNGEMVDDAFQATLDYQPASSLAKSAVKMLQWIFTITNKVICPVDPTLWRILTLKVYRSFIEDSTVDPTLSRYLSFKLYNSMGKKINSTVLKRYKNWNKELNFTVDMDLWSNMALKLYRSWVDDADDITVYPALPRSLSLKPCTKCNDVVDPNFLSNLALRLYISWRDDVDNCTVNMTFWRNQSLNLYLSWREDEDDVTVDQILWRKHALRLYSSWHEDANDFTVDPTMWRMLAWDLYSSWHEDVPDIKVNQTLSRMLAFNLYSSWREDMEENFLHNPKLLRSTNTSVEVEGNFNVDSTLGRRLALKLYTNSKEVTVSKVCLETPHGTRLRTSGTGLGTIWVSMAEEGLWKWRAIFEGKNISIMWETKVYASVISQPRDSCHTILARAWVSRGGPDNKYGPIAMYAEVKHAYNPIFNATVRAFVHMPELKDKKSKWKVELLDTGKLADVMAGDGIYSRYLTYFTTPGRYALKVKVFGNSTTRVNHQCVTCQLLRPPYTARRQCCGSTVPMDCKNSTVTGIFTRIAPTVWFQVTEAPRTKDMYPPMRVRDLQVTLDIQEVRLSKLIHPRLILTWTATGDEYDAGKVSGYEIRFSGNHTNLRLNFEDDCCNLIILSVKHSQSKYSGRLFLEAGRQVFLNLSLQEHEVLLSKVYHVALVAVDKKNKRSKVSNLAAFYYPVPELIKQLTDGEFTVIIIFSLVLIADVGGVVFYFLEKAYGTRAKVVV